MELEIRGWRCRKDREGSSDDLDYIGGNIARLSHQNGSQRSRDRSSKTVGRHFDTLKRDRHEHPSAALNTMSRALRRATRLPFFNEIESTEMPRHFNCPSFTWYDDKINVVEYVSHYIQMKSSYSRNDGLMCKVFPSSLEPTTMRWFKGLRKRSIYNFGELIQVFRALFITCSRDPQPIDALLSMKMGSGETFCSYANWFWKLYNEIGGGMSKSQRAHSNWGSCRI